MVQIELPCGVQIVIYAGYKNTKIQNGPKMKQRRSPNRGQKGTRIETPKWAEKAAKKNPKRTQKWTMDHPLGPPEAVRGAPWERLVAQAASRGGLGAPRGPVLAPPCQTYFLCSRGRSGVQNRVKLNGKLQRRQNSKNQYHKKQERVKSQGTGTKNNARSPRVTKTKTGSQNYATTESRV